MFRLEMVPAPGPPPFEGCMESDALSVFAAAAEIDADVVSLTADVLTANTAWVAPEGTVMLAGTVTESLELLSLITTPPGPAA